MAAAPEASYKPGGPWPSSTAPACPPPGGPAHQAYRGCSMESTGSRWGWWQKLFSFSAWCWFEAHGVSWRSSHSWQLPSFLAYSWPQTQEQSHSPASRRRQLIFLAGFQKSTSGRQHGYRCAAGRASPALQLDTVLQAGVTSVLQEDGTWLWGLSSSFSHLKCWGKYCRNWRQDTRQAERLCRRWHFWKEAVAQCQPIVKNRRWWKPLACQYWQGLERPPRLCTWVLSSSLRCRSARQTPVITTLRASQVFSIPKTCAGAVWSAQQPSWFHCHLQYCCAVSWADGKEGGANPPLQLHRTSWKAAAPRLPLQTAGCCRLENWSVQPHHNSCSPLHPSSP